MSQNRGKTRSRSRRESSVKALLAGLKTPLGERISTQRDAQARWRAWLATRLPPALEAHVCAVAEQEGVLTIFTESAAWSARLRFAVAEIEGQIRAERPNVTRVAVRARPARGRAEDGPPASGSRLPAEDEEKE